MSADPTTPAAWPGLIRRYAEYLPVNEETPVVTLLEGNTPLIRAERLARKIGGDIDLYLKYEGLNPTASFKDRGMTMAVSKAKERGAEVVVCASTGNTSASAAAYAARAGLKCVVLLPNGKIALGKLAHRFQSGFQRSFAGTLTAAAHFLRSSSMLYGAAHHDIRGRRGSPARRRWLCLGSYAYAAGFVASSRL